LFSVGEAVDNPNRTVTLSVQLDLQAAGNLSIGTLLSEGKQLHLGSFIRFHAKIVGSSLYFRPAARTGHTQSGWGLL
jgi:hypothetical protein